MATIKAIEGRTVHQIQSGQVIVDICSVVKELVENSLDAGATSIDVRFKNQGLDSIEVQDNGDGISPHNYETIALKHYTSKLSTYSDLTTLQTFGFRGEALSSLCALSTFVITTCMAQDAPKGTKLEFETSGKLQGTSVVAAQRGTTVSVADLFHNLPVRRRELERNIKREWGRVVGVLGQYACVQTGIKFSVTQQPSKGKKTTLFSTKGNQSTKENIINVFGAKTLTALVPLDLKLELEPTNMPGQKWSDQDDVGINEIRIVGHISRPAFGDGRQTPDRQMFFVNTRPCGLPQVAKAFNEVYRSYNASQSPFIFANIELDTHMYDVNVSPDKRTILLHDQTRMLENLKIALTELFESQDYTVPVSQLPAQRQPSYKQLTISRENSETTRSQQSPEILAASNRALASHDESGSGDSDDETESITPQESRASSKSVSRDSMDVSVGPVNLISDWLSRKTLDRSERESESNRPRRQSAESLSNGKKPLSRNSPRESAQTESNRASVENSEHSFPTTQTTKASSFSPPAQLPESSTNPGEILAETNQQTEAEASEPAIPALPPPPKPNSSVTNTFSGGTKPQRSPLKMATITIGDHTVTSCIGTPGPKRVRLGDSAAISHHSPSAGASTPMPTFGSRLSQRFSAIGTQDLGTGGDDVESEDNEDGSPVEVQEDSVDELENTDNEVEPDEPSSIPPVAQVETEEESLSNQYSGDEDEDEYVDEDEKKEREEARVQEMIKKVEESAAQPSEQNVSRAKALLKGGTKKKDATLNLVQNFDISISSISERVQSLDRSLRSYTQSAPAPTSSQALDSDEAEQKLSLTISKSDFAKMKIIGQFNLGFIIASRDAEPETKGGKSAGDELFIIDQHASDEKYNFERLQATTIVQSQRLVYPKKLDLTAMEEEIVIENLSTLETNGFIIKVDESGEMPIGTRCELVSLPLSRETAFTIADLEELLALLADAPTGSMQRPSKVRKMFAMRACRSSIMIGRTLTHSQMGKVVNHLGELDKPWNCPHGRPTMRHLCGLGVWDLLGWKEGDGVCDAFGDGLSSEKGVTDWAAYIRRNKEEDDGASSE